MDNYLFSLRGAQERFGGYGRSDGETFRSREFDLNPGIVCVDIRHHGYGDFKLEFVTTAGGHITTTGEAITDTITGWLIGGVHGERANARFAGWFSGGEYLDVPPTIWTPVDGKGKYDAFGFERVRDGDDEALPPGEWRLEVQSQSRWSCRFIQPALRQSTETLAEALSEQRWLSRQFPAGNRVMGPFWSGARPLLANIRHSGGGAFSFTTVAIDGTHQYVYGAEGQFIAEDQQTGILPGKEYLLSVWSNGEWNLAFTEGY